MQADKAGKRPANCLIKKLTKFGYFQKNYEAPQLKGMHNEILI